MRFKREILCYVVIGAYIIYMKDGRIKYTRNYS